MPFEKAKAAPKFLKVAVYGDKGAGKTHFALTFPKPAIIDLERGTDLFVDRFDFDRVQTDDYDRVMAELSWLETGFEHEERIDPLLGRKYEVLLPRRTGVHDYQTLIIDPVTILWEQIQFDQIIRVERSNRDNKDDYSPKDWGRMKRDYKSFMNRLINLPMHVVLTGRLAVIRENQTMKVLGERIDAEKSTEYAPDIVMKLVDLGAGKRVAIVEKDRSASYKSGDRIENPSWATFEPILAKMQTLSPVRIMTNTWRERGITDDQARAEIKRLTGKERSAELTPEEIVALTDHFRTWTPEPAAEAAAAAV